MRVIHAIPGIAKESSGTSYSVVRLCEALKEHGHELTLATLDWGPIPSSPVFLKNFPLSIGPRRLGRSSAMKRWLDQQVKSGNVDLLHGHGMWQMNAVYPGWTANKGKIPLVVSPRGALSEWAMRHGSRAKKIFWPLLQRPTLGAAACFHATAESEYKDIRRLGFHQPVAIVPNGIDIPELQSKAATHTRTLLFLGRIHPNKGLDMLLPAWLAVQDRFPLWRLLIAGSDDGYYGKSGHLDALRLLAQELGLKRVEFVGELHGLRKMEAYHRADLYVLPSYSENFGLTVAEALAAETPAITTRGTPWSGLEAHGAGWWVDIGIEPLVACLQEALALPRERLSQMGSLGREWMRTDFSWGQVAAMLSETYTWIRGAKDQVPTWVRLD